MEKLNEKVVSYYLRGFNDGETYSCVRDFAHSILDEYILKEVKPEHVKFLKSKGYTRTGDNGLAELFFPKGTKFIKLTAGFLDMRDNWQRFSLAENPEIKLLLCDGFVDMYELFGVKEPEVEFDMDNADQLEGYEFSKEDINNWFY